MCCTFYYGTFDWLGYFPYLKFADSVQTGLHIELMLPWYLASDQVSFSLAQVAQSIEDHHQEVIGFCRENGFHGLVAYDSDYALCNIPYYFSAHALKLSRNGKSLTTSQYLMHEVAKQLDLNPNRFPIFAALLGRWVL